MGGFAVNTRLFLASRVFHRAGVLYVVCQISLHT